MIGSLALVEVAPYVCDVSRHFGMGRSYSQVCTMPPSAAFVLRSGTVLCRVNDGSRLLEAVQALQQDSSPVGGQIGGAGGFVLGGRVCHRHSHEVLARLPLPLAGHRGPGRPEVPSATQLLRKCNYGDASRGL